jgi:hypothetical protein
MGFLEETWKKSNMFVAEYLSVLTAQVDQYSRTGLITSSGIKGGLGRDFER